jgi:hypothetical protein
MSLIAGELTILVGSSRPEVFDLSSQVGGAKCGTVVNKQEVVV